ncbi:MAG: transcriptional regulator [Alphaproteobacteria bacterium]|nr:transcriptional regulator [Alphaproteobacteria bacterium]
MTSFDHTELDDVIHGRLRLGVMAYLSTASPATFLELKAKVNATDGNLSAHLSKLEEAGYVRIEKQFEGKKPVTRAHLTEAGRDAWIAYLDRLKAMLSAAE